MILIFLLVGPCEWNEFDGYEKDRFCPEKRSRYRRYPQRINLLLSWTL
jgi:hypothetical protein